MNSPSFEYYINRCKEFEQATRRVKQWGKIYGGYLSDTFNSGDEIDRGYQNRLAIKYGKALNRLYKLIDNID